MSDLISIRAALPADRTAVDQLSLLESRRPLRGELLVAERAGRVVAAIALPEGEAVADPFEPTAALVELLALRRRQLARVT